MLFRGADPIDLVLPISLDHPAFVLSSTMPQLHNLPAGVAVADANVRAQPSGGARSNLPLLQRHGRLSIWYTRAVARNAFVT